jgi:hypothetical protein
VKGLSDRDYEGGGSGIRVKRVGLSDKDYEGGVKG